MSNEAITTAGSCQAAGVPGLSWKKRIAYGCGDTACNVVFGMTSALLTLFYTDYAGIPIATVGLVMLISRIFDGTSDLVMGVIVSKTKSKWGKARPWILWMAVPYVICAVAMFTIPQTSTSLQFWYILITYNLCTTICYTAINVPYGTLSTLMTRSSHEAGPVIHCPYDNGTARQAYRRNTDNADRKTVRRHPVSLGESNDDVVHSCIFLLLICFRHCEEDVVINAAENHQKCLSEKTSGHC